MLISRNFYQKCARANFRNYHTDTVNAKVDFFNVKMFTPKVACQDIKQQKLATLCTCSFSHRPLKASADNIKFLTYRIRLHPARYPSMAPFHWDLCGSDQWSKRLVELGAWTFKSKGWPDGLSPKVQNCKRPDFLLHLPFIGNLIQMSPFLI